MAKNSGDALIIRKIHGLPWGFIGLIVALCLIGIAMLYSAANGSFHPYAGPQIKRFILGFLLMMIIAVVDIRVWFRMSYGLYGLGVLLLILVHLMGFIGMGAQRWINIGGFNFQPSEMMKLFLVLALARYFHCLHLNNLQKLSILIIPILMIGVPVLLILKQPNLGTAAITGLSSVAILFVAGISIKKFVIVGGAGLASLPLVWNMLHDYQKQRVNTFLNPESDPLGAGYNIIQSKIAVGSGGLWGKGFMQGSQGQLSFLPEKQTDFIFTMLAEELGFPGGMLVLILYCAIMIYGLRIALQCESHFGKLICSGIITVLFLHVFINIAMTMGMVPVVGVPLPLLSYGGSNLLAMMIGFGFILNAHVHRDEQVNRALA